MRKRAIGAKAPEADVGEPRLPSKITRAYLDRAALSYLERFASSAENLRRVLTRKVERRCRARGEDPAAFAGSVAEVVERAVRSGLVDDRRYAEGRIATLRRRGGSSRLIAARLAAKGVERAAILEALRPDGEDRQAAELAAAWALARRRGLGPYRAKERVAKREKDLAALARAGFSFAVAREVVDGEPPDC
jgi:regulatory protein